MVSLGSSKRLSRTPEDRDRGRTRSPKFEEIVVPSDGVGLNSGNTPNKPDQNDDYRDRSRSSGPSHKESAHYVEPHAVISSQPVEVKRKNLCRQKKSSHGRYGNTFMVYTVTTPSAGQPGSAQQGKLIYAK